MSAAASGKQGITSILASDSESPKEASLRRTLSADMLFRKWVGRNNLLSSSDEHGLDHIACSPIDCPEEEEQEEREGELSESKSQYDIWNSIQKVKDKTKIEETGQSNIWSLILSQKSDRPVPAAPYIHPLAKRSAASLSEKSLDICTESLGSETGSNGFSSYPSSETGDGEEDKEELTEEAERMVLSNTVLISRKRQLQQLTPSRSFPRPLPSLSRQNGASLHVQSRRDNGRLVLEAVSVKEEKNFRARREGGRLVLTFINHPSSNDHDDESDVEGTDDGPADDGATDDNEDGEIQEKDVEAGEVMELVTEELPKLSSGEVSVNKLAILTNKSVVLADGYPVLPDRLAELVIFKDIEEETVQVQASLSQLTRLTQLIVRQPTAGATSSGDRYQFLWKAESAAMIDPTAEQLIVIKSYNDNNYVISQDTPASKEKRELLVLTGNSADYLVPLIQNCKDARRSLLFLGPHCIATS